MPHARPLARLAPLVAIAALVLAAACSGDGPTESGGTSSVPDAIQAQIDALFPEGSLRASATSRVEDVLEQADAGQAAQAQSTFLDFVVFGSVQAAGGTLLDPNGGSAPTTEDALATLVNDVADEAGLAIPAIPGAAFSADGAVGTVDASGGQVVTANRSAGVSIPAGALSGKTLITIERIAATGGPGDGPLPTTLDQYPRFYRIETFPAGVTLAQVGVVGLCVVDPPDPLAPDPDVAGRLRIAHTDPADPQSIEILPFADAPFLDCDALQGSLSPASPGRLGGSISSFSPFAAVDPGPLPPAILSVTPNPIPSSVIPGNTTEVTIAFLDFDGDIVRMDFNEVSDTNDVLEPGSIPLDDLTGATSGTFTVDVGCNANSPSDCNRGTWTGDFVLVDAAGNESPPFRVTIVFE